MEWGYFIIGVVVVLFALLITFVVIMGQKSKKAGGPGGLKGA